MKRHARIADIDPTLILKMLDRWPLPRQEPFDKYGPGWALGWMLRQDKGHLQELCEKHGLKTSGERTKLVRRLYLHDRSRRMRLGDPRIGYGPGHEEVRTPKCECGRWLRKDLEALMAAKAKNRERKKLQQGAHKKRFPRLARYPRN